MKHVHYNEWLSYVRGDTDEILREEYESHLYTCDECLAHYLQAVEVHEASFPILTNEAEFTELIMTGINNQNHLDEKSKPQLKRIKKPIFQQAAFHYLLATAATLLLTFSGAFQSLAGFASSIEEPNLKERKASVTEGVINKTFAWMDALEVKEEVTKK